jgi:hypothetical protein
VRTVLVPTNMVDGIWPNVVAGFQKASRRSGGDLTVGDLWVGCRSGHCFLFIVHEGDDVKAATVWKQETWQSGTKFRCLALYGTGMSVWLDEVITSLARVARDCGAEEAIFEGRKGWDKVLKNRGVRLLRCTYSMDIPKEPV